MLGKGILNETDKEIYFIGYIMHLERYGLKLTEKQEGEFKKGIYLYLDELNEKRKKRAANKKQKR